jgi:Ni,Fe-hydrogenase maturation factor
MLFLPGYISSASPINFRNSSDFYSQISKEGEVVVFGNVYYDSEQFISIVCAHDLEINETLMLLREKIQTAKGLVMILC